MRLEGRTEKVNDRQRLKEKEKDPDAETGGKQFRPAVGRRTA